MSIKTPEERLRNYAYRMNGKRIKAKLEAYNPEMVERYAAAAARQIEIEEKARQILAEEPVYGADYGKYHAFARSIDAATRKFGGFALVEEAKSIVDRWTKRACINAVLKRIVIEVFGIDLRLKVKRRPPRQRVTHGA